MTWWNTSHVRPAAEVLDEVEADAPDSAVVQSGVVGLGEGRIDDRDAAVASAAGLDGVEHGAIVGPVAARLNDDRPFDAEDRLQRRERLFRRIRRRIGPIGRVRECRRQGRRCGNGRHRRAVALRIAVFWCSDRARRTSSQVLG